MRAVVALAVFACVATMVAGGGYDYGYGGYDARYYGPELRPVYNGVAAPYNNAARQVAVNYAAEYKGASSGTARYYGVPGTGNNFGYNYGYGYPYGRY